MIVWCACSLHDSLDIGTLARTVEFVKDPLRPPQQVPVLVSYSSYGFYFSIRTIRLASSFLPLGLVALVLRFTAKLDELQKFYPVSLLLSHPTLLFSLLLFLSAYPFVTSFFLLFLSIMPLGWLDADFVPDFLS